MYEDFLPHHSSGITKKGQDAKQLVVSEDTHCLALKTGMTTSSSWEQVCGTFSSVSQLFCIPQGNLKSQTSKAYLDRGKSSKAKRMLL